MDQRKISGCLVDDIAPGLSGVDPARGCQDRLGLATSAGVDPGKCRMNPSLSERARAARILGTITFHFDASRLGFLAEVLRSLSEFPVAFMDVVIVTNTFREAGI